MQINTKQAQNEDVAILLDIDQKAFCRDFDTPFNNQEEILSFLKSSSVFLIEADGQIAGYYSYEFKDNNEAEMTGIAILPQYQDKGIGTSILIELKNTLKDRSKIYIHTHPENQAAIRLYWKSGFVIESWLEKYYDDKPRVRMVFSNLA